MWATDTGLNDVDPHELQRRREAYARELEQQIAMRRSCQQKDQMEREELERKLAPSEHSPSKWLAEGGHVDVSEGSRLSWQRTKSANVYEEKIQDRGAATCETSTESSSYPRFRVINESETSQRLRERAQQMQWKKILDEQVQEKVRLKQQEEVAKRRSEEEAAREEVRYLQEEQQRAQRRLGRFSPRVNAQAIDYKVKSKSPYHKLSSTPALAANKLRNDFESTTNNFHDFACTSDPRKEEAKPTHCYNDQQHGNPGITDTLSPSPAVVRIPLPQEDEQNRLNDGVIFDRSRKTKTATSSSRTKNEDVQASQQHVEQHRQVIEEYCSLLADIRREREKLRQERDEIRREKEELRVQRVLLQLENEKRANLVDAQQAFIEQHQSDLQTEQVQQAQQLSQQQQDHAMAFRFRETPVQSVEVKKASMRRRFEHPRQQGDDPELETYLQMNPIRQTLGNLSIYNKQSKPASLGRQMKPIISMSMADISAPPCTKRMANDIVNSPEFQDLPQYCPIPPNPLYEENRVLNQSLVNESVFVPLSPKLQNETKHSELSPRSAFTSESEDINSHRLNPLRNSRVIRSRGFYDIEHEAKNSVKADSCASRSISDVEPYSASSSTRNNDQDKLGAFDHFMTSSQ